MTTPNPQPTNAIRTERPADKPIGGPRLKITKTIDLATPRVERQKRRHRSRKPRKGEKRAPVTKVWPPPEQS